MGIIRILVCALLVCVGSEASTFDECLQDGQFGKNGSTIKINRPNSVKSQCVYRLVAEPSHFLRLEMVTIEVPQYGFNECFTCMCGLLQFYDGENLLGEWCYGRVTSKIITSLGGQIRVVYQPDVLHSFNATFNFNVNATSSTGARLIERYETEDERSSWVTSQGFPKAISPGGHSLWIFDNRRPDSTLKLSFNDMLLPTHSIKVLCMSDFVQIYDGFPKVNGTHKLSACGRKFPDDFYSTGRIVSVQFEPESKPTQSSDDLPPDQYSLGFNFTYEFFPSAVTDKTKYIDAGSFIDSDDNYGGAFTFQVSREDMPRSLNNQNQRSRWILVPPQPYDFFLVAVNNFSVNPTAARPDSSISGVETVATTTADLPALSVRDGLLSSSKPLYYVNSATMSPADAHGQWLYTSGPAARIDMRFPADTLGTIHFSYTAARWLQPEIGGQDILLSNCDSQRELRCEKFTITNGVKQLRHYCIDHSLVCDGVINCIQGEDEKQCKSQVGFGNSNSGASVGATAKIIVVVFGIAVVVLVVPLALTVWCRKHKQQRDRRMRSERLADANGGSTRSRNSGGGTSDSSNGSAGQNTSTGGADDDYRVASMQSDYHNGVTPPPIVIANVDVIAPPYYTEQPPNGYSGRIGRPPLPSVNESDEEAPSTDDRAALIPNQISSATSDPFTA
jgi:hypothetical protein